MNRAVLLILTFAIFGAIALTGCGSGGAIASPNPSGFNNASLKGTYTFAISGNNGTFFSIVGSFVADGNGNITSGVEDINSPGTIQSGVATGIAINGGYIVRSDGRTIVNISSTSLNPVFKFTMDFVLLNTQKGLVIEFDQQATASGSVDLQNSSAFSLSSLAGSFALNVGGIDSLGNPESSVGLINTDNAGNITGGSLDDNDNFAVTSNAPLSPTTLTAPASGTGRGTATVTSGSAPRNFAYYVVDSNHLKLVEIDGSGPFLSGDAFRQSAPSVSGNFAFTLAGETLSGHGVFLGGGILNTDGAGNIQNTSVIDLDIGGSTTATGGVAVQGTYTLSGGRGTMQLTGPTTLNLVFYPSTAGLQMLEVDANSILASGVALQQTGGPFSNSSINNGYGLNFTGVVGAGSFSGASEIDAIAQFNATTSGTISGALDTNNSGATTSSQALSGSFTVAANGRGTAGLRTSQQPINLIFYMVSSSQVVFIELDEGFGQLSVGTFASQ